MVRLHRLLVPLATALALSGCMSIGGLGGYPGGGYPDGSSYPGQGYPPQQGAGQSIVGNVDQTDHGNGRFMMRTDGSGYGAYGNRIEIYYDRNTPAYFRGQQVAPSGLRPAIRSGCRRRSRVGAGTHARSRCCRMSAVVAVMARSRTAMRSADR